MDLFLILSGFTLAAYSAAIPMREFVLRRFLRIYPSYWLALLLFGYLDAHYLGGPRPWESVWQHIIGIHGFSRREYFSDFSDSFWFISMISPRTRSSPASAAASTTCRLSSRRAGC